MYDAGNIAPDDEDIVYEYDSDNTLKRILQKYEKDGEIKYRRLVRSAYDLRGNVTAIKTKNGYYQNVTYDAKNRLKKAEGDYSEYWYDADDNRIDMYDHSTNMKYTYDCAGGRSRLVWTSSHLYEVTTYAYGAEGLIWSRTDGSYQVYHYDYRGSVIAVTDIDGNITDTITYTAYGKQASRTGTSKLIFGYNGRHGVLSDPNGLLYMRTRFYNPDFKRFMSADIIDGSIADSTSLNVYAFVNGNPISLIDPFGLSSTGGEKSPSLIHKEKEYPIYVPKSYEDYIDSNWKTVDVGSDGKFMMDYLKFLLGIQLEDINRDSLYAGNVEVSSGYISDPSALKKLGILNIFTGVLDSFRDSADLLYVKVLFQENGQSCRAIVLAGSTDVEKAYDLFSGQTNSLYENTATGKINVMTAAGKFYQELTGNGINPLKKYDVQITVDSRHREVPYASYLSVSKDGTIIETPMIFSNDKVAVGTRGFLGIGFTPLAYAPLGGSSPVAAEYQSMFNKLYDKYN